MFKILNTIQITLKRQHLVLILTVILSFTSITTLTIFYLIRAFTAHRTVYVIDNEGNAILLRETNENPRAEAKAHFKNFHDLFFNQPPDGRQIQENISLALNLCDGSGKAYFDAFKEQHYYNKLIASNISQSLRVDSILISNNHPYQAKLFGKILLIRPTMVIERNLITSGQLRRIGRSDNNPHGFLIEKFKILELKDLKTYTRNE